MQKLIGRILDGLNHRRMAMTGAAHRNAGRKIQKAVAIDVPNFRPLAVRHHEGIVARIGRRNDQRIAREQLPRLRARQIGLYVRFLHLKSISPSSAREDNRALYFRWWSTLGGHSVNAEA